MVPNWMVTVLCIKMVMVLIPQRQKISWMLTMKAMPEGTMFHSVTYGKGQMGSYASQLNTKQRWKVIAYIKSKQCPAGTPAADTTAKPCC